MNMYTVYTQDEICPGSLVLAISETHSVASPSEAVVVVRFVNSTVGAGRNISCDLHMEHLNQALKTAMSGLGANVTKGSIARASKCLKVVTDVATNFDDPAGVPFVSERHSEASYKHDLKLIVEELNKRSQVFHYKPKSHHASFRKLNHSIFKLNKKLKSWFKHHAKE